MGKQGLPIHGEMNYPTTIKAADTSHQKKLVWTEPMDTDCTIWPMVYMNGAQTGMTQNIFHLCR